MARTEYRIIPMAKKWYVRYSDAEKAEAVTFDEFCIIKKMARFYNALVAENFHPHGKTLTVGFAKHFV